MKRKTHLQFTLERKLLLTILQVTLLDSKLKLMLFLPCALFFICSYSTVELFAKCIQT